MDIFREVKTVTGAEVVHRYDSKNKVVYLIGEDHEFNGVTNHPYIVDVLLKSTGELTLLLECGKGEVITAADVVRRNGKSKSPIQEVAYRFVEEPFAIHRDVDIRLVDIRRDDPFGVLEMLTNLRSYLFVNRPHEVASLKSYRAFLKKAKMFEKEAFFHFKSRVGLERFVLGLIHPERKTPIWFSKWCVAFGHSGDEHPVKQELRELLENDGRTYDLVMKYIRDRLDHQLLDVSIFSYVMSSVEKERRTASPNMELDKSAPLNTFFVALFGMLLDVNLLLRAFGSRTDVCILAGAKHVFDIARALSESGYDRAYTVKMNGMGFMDFADKTASSIENPLFSPEDLLANHKKQKRKQ